MKRLGPNYEQLPTNIRLNKIIQHVALNNCTF